MDDNILRISTTCKIQYTLDKSGDSTVNIIVRRTPSHTTNFFVPFLDNTILVFPYLFWKGVFWYTTMTSTDIENWSIDEFRSSIRPEHSITNIKIWILVRDNPSLSPHLSNHNLIIKLANVIGWAKTLTSRFGRFSLLMGHQGPSIFLKTPFVLSPPPTNMI